VFLFGLKITPEPIVWLPQKLVSIFRQRDDFDSEPSLRHAERSDKLSAVRVESTRLLVALDGESLKECTDLYGAELNSSGGRAPFILNHDCKYW
jgi:hypothetical protein